MIDKRNSPNRQLEFRDARRRHALIRRSVPGVGLLAALCVQFAFAASTLAQFSDFQESPWQGGVLNFYGNTLITSAGTFNNFAGLVYDTSTLPADTGPLYAWDLAPGVAWSGNYYDGVGVLLNVGSGTNIINNNSGGTMQSRVTDSGQAFGFGINANGNVTTINNSGLIDGEVWNNDGTAAGVYASGIVTITNTAEGNISAIAPYYAGGIYTVGGAQTIINNGTITATATGGTQNENGENTANQAYAAGVDMFSYDPSDRSPMCIVNNGSITVSCTGGATNIAHCAAIWNDQNDVTWINNGTMVATMTGSSGDASGIYFGANNTNVTFINTGTIFNGGGQGGQGGEGMWMENDGTTGNMYFYNSGTIASGEPFAASIASYPGGPGPYGTAYATNTGTIMGGWLGFGWCGNLTFYDSGDILTGLAWLGGATTFSNKVYYGNVTAYINGLPTIQPTLSAGSGSNTLVFNLTGTLQQVNGNAASGTNLSGFKLVPSGSIVVSGKTYSWANFSNVSGTITVPVAQPAGPAGLTATTISSSQASLAWNAVGNATAYNVKRSTMNHGPYTTIASSVTATNYTDNAAFASVRYYYVVSAIVGGLESSNSPQAAANLPLPNRWVSQDLGGVGVDGSAAYGNGVFTISGAGADIQASSDAFQFVYAPATNNCVIIARVLFVQNIDSWSKAGVMIRDSLDPGAANAFMAVTPGNGATFQYRSTDGGGTSWNQAGGLSAPYWVKLVLSGGTFTGYGSPDGANWTQQGTASFTMGSSVYVGLAITSHDSSNTCTALFDNLTAPGWSNPAPPQAPDGLAAALISSNQIGLAWSIVTNAVSYNVKRSTNNDGPYTVIANDVTTTNYSDTGLAGGTIYYFVVSAVNTNGESPNSVQASTATPPPLTLAGHWLGGAANFTETSGKSPAGTFDGFAVASGSHYFTNDVPPNALGVSLHLNNSGIGISNTCRAWDAGYANAFDNAITNNFTVMCWAKGWPGTWNPWVSKYGETEAGWQLRQDGSNTNGYPCWTIRDNGAGTVTLGGAVYGNPDDLASRSIAPGDDGKWHHYAGTFNAVSGVRCLYVDGNLAAAETGNAPYNLAATNRLMLGAKDSGSTTSSSGGYGNYFTGNLYDVRIYNSALWQSQIRSLAGLTPPSPTVQLVGGNPTGGNQMSVSWSWGTLLQATNLLGPWASVSTAPPYATSQTGAQQFFRVSNP